MIDVAWYAGAGSGFPSPLPAPVRSGFPPPQPSLRGAKWVSLTPALSQREREPVTSWLIVSSEEALKVGEQLLPSPAGRRVGDEGQALKNNEHSLPSPAGRRVGDEGKADCLLPSPAGRRVGDEGHWKPPLPPELLQRCRELRRGGTDAESLLWQFLRSRQLAGAKFRRQHPLRGYILDFYCHEARLAVELDGAGHAEPEQAASDAERTRILRAEGIRVLRFWNNEVLQRTEGVLEAIWEALDVSPLQRKQ